ncbi:hypothetical protein PR048_000649 [Dryococelus australis]|uniref:Uncharacterized protein n=1 Tax=Dryococelus australis TaxID=614101 RepID=A0ABQ9IF80_9NEOP|nr:hypothetical protein PR048_000649 [Dryococelus australis]
MWVEGVICVTASSLEQGAPVRWNKEPVPSLAEMHAWDKREIPRKPSWQDSHLRESGSDPTGDLTRFTSWWEASAVYQLGHRGPSFVWKKKDRICSCVPSFTEQKLAAIRLLVRRNTATQADRGRSLSGEKLTYRRRGREVAPNLHILLPPPPPPLISSPLPTPHCRSLLRRMGPMRDSTHGGREWLPAYWLPELHPGGSVLANNWHRSQQDCMSEFMKYGAKGAFTCAWERQSRGFHKHSGISAHLREASAATPRLPDIIQSWNVPVGSCAVTPAPHHSDPGSFPRVPASMRTLQTSTTCGCSREYRDNFRTSSTVVSESRGGEACVLLVYWERCREPGPAHSRDRGASALCPWFGDYCSGRAFKFPPDPIRPGAALARHRSGSKGASPRLIGYGALQMTPRWLDCRLVSNFPAADWRTRYDGNTASLARWRDEALGVRVSVAVSLPRFLTLDAGFPRISLLASHQGFPGSIPGRVTPDFRMWEPCRTMTLVGGFSRGSPVFPAHSFRCRSIPQSLSSVLKTSMSRAVQISSLNPLPSPSLPATKKKIHALSTFLSEKNVSAYATALVADAEKADRTSHTKQEPPSVVTLITKAATFSIQKLAVLREIRNIKLAVLSPLDIVHVANTRNSGRGRLRCCSIANFRSQRTREAFVLLLGVRDSCGRSGLAYSACWPHQLDAAPSSLPRLSTTAPQDDLDCTRQRSSPAHNEGHPVTFWRVAGGKTALKLSALRVEAMSQVGSEREFALELVVFRGLGTGKTCLLSLRTREISCALGSVEVTGVITRRGERRNKAALSESVDSRKEPAPASRELLARARAVSSATDEEEVGGRSDGSDGQGSDGRRVSVSHTRQLRPASYLPRASGVCAGRVDDAAPRSPTFFHLIHRLCILPLHCDTVLMHPQKLVAHMMPLNCCVQSPTSGPLFSWKCDGSVRVLRTRGPGHRAFALSTNQCWHSFPHCVESTATERASREVQPASLLVLSGDATPRRGEKTTTSWRNAEPGAQIPRWMQLNKGSCNAERRSLTMRGGFFKAMREAYRLRFVFPRYAQARTKMMLHYDSVGSGVYQFTFSVVVKDKAFLQEF